MIGRILVLIEKVFNRFLFYYRRELFLSKTGNKSKSLRIQGKIFLNATNVKIGDNVNIYPGVYFWGDGEIIIGNNVDIGVGTIIFSKRKVVIGNDVAIAGQCYIIDSNHSVRFGKLIREQSLDVSENGIYIGNDVWIGAGCKIIKDAVVNDGVVIGAMSLVNSEIKQNCIAFGIPAKEVNIRK